MPASWVGQILILPMLIPSVNGSCSHHKALGSEETFLLGSASTEICWAGTQGTATWGKTGKFMQKNRCFKQQWFETRAEWQKHSQNVCSSSSKLWQNRYKENKRGGRSRMREALKNSGWRLRTSMVIFLQDLKIRDTPANYFDIRALGRAVPANEWTGKKRVVGSQTQVPRERAKGKSFKPQRKRP